VLTERMALRRFTPADAATLVSLDVDPLVMRYLEGGTKSLAQVGASTATSSTGCPARTGPPRKGHRTAPGCGAS
jgi:hypothetical protein